MFIFWKIFVTGSLSELIQIYIEYPLLRKKLHKNTTHIIYKTGNLVNHFSCLKGLANIAEIEPILAEICSL